MKNLGTTLAASALIALAATSCDAMWGTSVDLSPDTYSVGVSTTYPGYYNPLYWGNDYYPGIGYYPGTVYPGPVRPHRPGWGIAGNPVNPPLRPGGSGSIGNVRPGSGNASTPTPLPDNRPINSGNSVVPPAGTFPNISGAEPGVVMPPSGSGMRPGRK